MHPAQSRRRRHERAEANLETVDVYRFGARVGRVTPMTTGEYWVAEVLEDGGGFAGIGAHNTILTAELDIINHAKKQEGF